MSITKLSTGKEVYSNGEIFGVTKDLLLTEGYDGIIYQEPDDDGPSDNLTPSEMCEIADMMIARWQAFKSRWGK